MDDVIFSYDRTNGQNEALMFRRVRQDLGCSTRWTSDDYSVWL